MILFFIHRQVLAYESSQYGNYPDLGYLFGGFWTTRDNTSLNTSSMASNITANDNQTMQMKREAINTMLALSSATLKAYKVISKYLYLLF